MAVSKTDADHRGVVAVLVLAGVVAFSVTRDSRNQVAVQTQKVAPRATWSRWSPPPARSSPRVRERERQRLRPHHGAATSRRGTAVRRGPGAGPHRLHALRGGRARSRRRRCRRRGPTSTAPRPTSRSRASPSSAAKKMHADKLISDQAYDQARRRAQDEGGGGRGPEAPHPQQEAHAGQQPRRPRRRRPWSRPWTAWSPASRRRRASRSSAPRASRPP